MSQNDPFFDDEEELARAEAEAEKPKAAKPAAEAEAGKPANKKAAASKADAAAGKADRKPPSFALVVAIALVALLLGVCIGYFMAMMVVSNSSTTTTSTAVVASTASTADEDSEDSTLPAGHPDLTQFMDEDGNIDQDKVEAYKAALAESGDAEDDTEEAAA